MLREAYGTNETGIVTLTYPKSVNRESSDSSGSRHFLLQGEEEQRVGGDGDAGGARRPRDPRRTSQHVHARQDPVPAERRKRRRPG